RCLNFGYGRDHRNHNSELASGRRPEQSLHLRAEQPWPVERDADGAPTECRVLLLGLAEIGEDFVPTNVEATEYDRLFPGAVQDLPVGLGLLVPPRKRRRDHELQLGAEQTDAFCTRLGQMRYVDK